MKDITLSCLKIGHFRSKHFSQGERVRIYINYAGDSQDIEVREGEVLDPNKPKKRRGEDWTEPALSLKVDRVGQVVDKVHEYEDDRKYPFVASYFYGRIGLVERLEEVLE